MTEIRDAATVVLVRDGMRGVEAWLLTRVAQMAFAANMSVFPGGRVDAGDADLPWSGPAPATFAERLGCDESTARQLVGAAVRETFEETGVLLTVPPGTAPPAARADVEGGMLPFGALLRARGLAVDATALHPWARWVTPEGEARRYDARFFVAALPDGAEPDHVTTEAVSAGWVPLAQALAEFDAGTRRLLPPTLVTLRQVGAHADVAAVVAAAADRRLEPVRPQLRREAGGVELPDGTIVPVPAGMFRR